MAIKLYAIINAETGDTVKTVQVKRRDMAEKCIDEYLQIGTIPSGIYRVELIAKERN